LIRNGFYLEDEVRSFRFTCKNESCSIEHYPIHCLLENETIIMSIKEEEINFAGKTFKGRESNFTTKLYIIIMLVLTSLSIFDLKRKPINGSALHLLTLGDSYMIIIHSTSTIAFQPTSLYFYGFGLLTIMNFLFFLHFFIKNTGQRQNFVYDVIMVWNGSKSVKTLIRSQENKNKKVGRRIVIVKKFSNFNCIDASTKKKKGI
jgi:hypothetical protein